MSILFIFFIFTLEPVISVGDVLLISAPGVKEIEEKEVFVGRSGRIFLPLVGEVLADSLTPHELEVSIIKAISPYVRNPEVFVSIKKSAKNKVCIYGEVAKPGVYRFIDGYTIGEAINLAGGSMRYADLDRIRIKKANGTESVIEMKEAQGLFIEPFDMIYLPKFDDILVVGKVSNPGVFTPTGSKVKLSDVLSPHTWRFTKNANRKKVKIVKDKESEIVDLDRASEIELKPGDVVVILGKRRNILMETLNFAARYVALASLGLMIYWHYQ